MQAKKIALILALPISTFTCLLLTLSLPAYAAGPFTESYVTLRNGRLSFRSTLNGAISAGGATGKINSSGNPDNDTLNLFNNDQVCFNNPADPTDYDGCTDRTAYTVSGREADNLSFSLSSGVTSGAASGMTMVASQSGKLVFTFKSTVDLPAGSKIKFVLPTVSDSNKYKDGIPDQAGFDIGDIVAGDLPTISSFSPGSTTITSGTITYSSATVTFVLTTATAQLNSGTEYTLTFGHSSDTTKRLINPAPATTHTTRGLADQYGIAFQTLDSSDVVQNESLIKVAPNDGVLVSVNVPLFITYQITGVSSGQTVSCAGGTNNITTVNTTTATTAPYGTATANGTTFYDIAQTHTVTTNAASGYTLSVYSSGGSSGPLTHTDGSTYIPHTSCDSNGCTTAGTFAAWTSTSNYGFGFSCSTSTCNSGWTRFSYSADSPVTFRTTAAPATSETTTTCYRLNFSGTQKAGYYTSTLTYVAVPKF